MPISSGTRLGPYEIVARIGAGGMGEVFRARDTRLDRSVAIKVLPPEFAGNAESKLRFEREARVISQLNHPHICTLHDVGDQDGTSFLVMELLEGESLADRLMRGPLPVAEVIRYGGQIAAALDRAHRAGIVHRDLKPGNIMITRAGAKLLDFGLAKPAAAPIAHDALTQQKPLTAEGTIVGTFQYMAPEQLEGLDADPRTDIFALGVILYEMTTGTRAFSGRTRTSLAASIVSGEPRPLSEVQPAAPPQLTRLIAHCLRKEREDRWQSAHDVRLELETIQDVAPPVSKRRPKVSWLAAALAALVLAATAAFWVGRQATAADSAGPVRVNIAPPANGEIVDLALSPDGRRLAMSAQADPAGVTHLWIRDLSTGSAMRIDETAGAFQPFWSPDGRSVGFAQEGFLRRVPASGGAIETICPVKNAFGATWNAEDTIVFSEDDVLYRVRADGGEVKRLSPVGDEGFSWPSFLPDGRHYLVASDGGSGPSFVGVLSLDDKGPARPLVPTFSTAAYAAPGYLLFVRGRVLSAQRLDTKTFTVSGDPIRLGEQVDDNDFGQYVFTVSQNGTLAFRSRDVRSRLHLRDAKGKELARFGEPADWAGMVVSPDQTKALVERVDEQRRNGSLWLFDLTTGGVSRLSTESGWHGIGAWAEDGVRYAYLANPGGDYNMYESRIDSTITRKISDLGCQPQSWVGDWVSCEIGTTETAADILLVSASTGQRVDVAATKAWESGSDISPDGKWVLYASGTAGSGGTFVQPISPNGQRWQLLSGDVAGSFWSSDGKSLYGGLMDGTLFRFPFFTDNGRPRVGPPQPVTKVQAKLFKNRMPLAVLDGGDRFLVNELEDGRAPSHIVLNWTAALRR